LDVALFDFELPEQRIALRPAVPRDSARMLVVDGGAREDHTVSKLPDFLREGDVLVVNDTRVIPARLNGIRQRGEAVAQIEATLHKREDAQSWRAFVRPAKKLKIGEIVQFLAASGANFALADFFLHRLSAEIVEKNEGEVLFRFNLSGAELDQAIEHFGHMPLPPYIAAKRDETDADSNDYQTFFAQKSGAVAAPTAGLHFTPELVDRIEKKGVKIAKVTLHVGAGTFLPMKADDTDDHKMHAEYGEVSAQAADLIDKTRKAGGRVVAVGTTSLRILESAARSGEIRPFAGETSIFITPGYDFKVVDVLLTNFHLPRSTLFMLVSAFSGLPEMQAAYAHAIAHEYRFYSYGDACLLFRKAA